ncbi:haloacid dehalogenase-like hydrolase [Granulicatella sp. zg-ZJ]|uniref:haloacid dehalogenase-like hydrolase n=1 Tax=unclassified Granulicatella TaxID=2630493 RepID=UPI0013C151F2|nr:MULTISPECIES: haloacid dehalogenase-like hydrolase [unclassified Granulicatella]MBS4750709.1 haloacid dehalogenase-like hydrolase [Carnobacteriaceae bacterium zg-ZUI78]NEW61882.1 haloacid dehalogenase-like hydrolase [Granulicatella sp. zg-ZJ]NEW65956.1 haloacid dehalogenase-like hydrolase [Granulicatella sp. zg-84]QMI85180.1 haloacid dehalogenase-like hydrolase [Carnobacteriaceae bacterium zg-84]
MKKRVIFMCGATLLLAACQAPQTTKMEQTTTQQAQSVKTLEKGVWEDKLYARLSKLVADNGKTNANYKADAKPYAVFDWDNTTIINDIGEATFTYQIMNLEFKMTPEKFGEAIRKNLPSDDFKEDWNNKDGGRVNIDKIAKDLESDYTFLYNNYSGMKGTKSLDELKSTDEYKDFSAKLRYLYEAVGSTFSSDISYPWVTYLYAGMTSEEVQALTEKSIDYALKDELKEETWESPATLKGEAGQVSVSFKTGVRSVKEMQDLYATLMENGIDVYICSASYIDVIIPYATNSKYGYNIPKENIYAMMLSKDSNGVIQAELNPEYAQTQGAGKTETIKKYMAATHKDKEPILIAGDSNGDYAMLTDFKDLQVGIIFNRIRPTEKGIGKLSKEAADTYDKDDARYFLQGRDENKGILLHGRETILLGKTEAELLKK